MANRIGRREAIGGALWRLLRDDLAGARDDLCSKGAPEQRIHSARQRLKRARSLMRVLAPALDHKAGDLRRALASAARLVAGARDADAAAASARGLRESVPDADDAGFGAIADALDHQAEVAHRYATPVEDVISRLRAVEADVDAAAHTIKGAALFDDTLARTYGKGRKAMRRARSSLATPDLHAWRKQAKSLWHLLRLGRARLPAEARRLAARLDRLGEILGLDHDHAMLAEKLALSPTGDPALMRQLSIIAGQRRKLEAEAFAIGAKVFRQRPKRFARRIRLD